VDYVFNRIVQDDARRIREELAFVEGEEEAKNEDDDEDDDVEEKEEDDDEDVVVEEDEVEEDDFDDIDIPPDDDPQNAIELRVALDELLGFRRNAFMFLQNITWSVMFIVVYMCAFVMMPMFMGLSTVWTVRSVRESQLYHCDY
jgi:hypothetical protein